MRILIDGVIYDSTQVAVLVEFDENEQRLFDMKRFVSTPPTTTEKERMELLEFRFEDVPEVIKSNQYVVGCHHNHITTWNHGYHNMCMTCGERNVVPIRE